MSIKAAQIEKFPKKADPAVYKIIQERMEQAVNGTNLKQLKEIYKEASVIETPDEKWLKLKSQLIAKAAFIGSNTPVESIPNLMQKLDDLYEGFIVYKKNNSLIGSSKLDQINYLNQYLWKNNGSRNVGNVPAIPIPFETAINHQILYSQASINLKVSDTLGLTTLFNVLAVRAGIEVKTVMYPGYIYNWYEGQVIESAMNPGLRNAYTFEIPVESLKDEILVSAFDVTQLFFSSTGSYFIKHGQFKKAEAALKKGLAIRGGEFTSIMSLVSISIEQEKYAEAIQYLNQLVASNPKLSSSKEILSVASIDLFFGICYASLRQYEKAIEYFLKDISHGFEDKTGNTYFNLGSSHGALKQYDKAIECFSKAIAINPNNTYAIQYLKAAKNAKNAASQSQKMAQSDLGWLGKLKNIFRRQ